MFMKIQTFRGQDCGYKSGCEIKFDQNVSPQYFNSNEKYYLLSGELSIQYGDESTQTISSPYNSHWNSYVDSWDYSKSVRLKIKPSTFFLYVSDPNNPPGNSKVSILSNNSSIVTMNSNSTLMVFGSSFLVDDIPFNKTKTVLANAPKTVQVSTSDSCSLVYIEPL